jgi:ParB family chromosome partitioning protein
MYESTRQLDQTFVERSIGFAPLGQPERLKHLMGFVKELLIKALEKVQVLGIEHALPQDIDQSGDFSWVSSSHLILADRGPIAKLQNAPTLDFIDKRTSLSHSGGMAKPALGRGLGALLGGSPIAKPPSSVPVPAVTPIAQPAPNDAERVERVPLERIRPCPLQPRKDFPPETLRELADSIREQGIVQPLIVRERSGTLELIAGERRWRAAQLLGLSEVPVIVRPADDRSVLELALIENLQRENLNAIEEANGYAQLIGQFGLKQEEAAAKVGKSRAAVANALRLLKLPATVQAAIRDGRLSVGHAKVILGLANEQQQRRAAERILKAGMSVRQTEALVASLLTRGAKGPALDGPAGASARDPHVATIENQLRERLGTKVHLRYAQGKGALEISFFSEAELDRILQILGVAAD